MNLVIVESPAKAKTINKYLGDNYTVLASYGHIRDLPSKNGSVDPDQNFKMEWEVDSFSKKYLKEITDALRNVGRPYVFSNSIAPPVVGASLEVFKMLDENDHLELRLFFCGC